MKKSFTLVDLLITIVIMGLILSVVFANIVSMKKDSISAMIGNNISIIQNSTDIYHLKNGQYPTKNKIQPTYPSFVHFDKLQTTYLKKTPDEKIINPQYYWLDYWSVVWGSTVPTPNNFIHTGEQIEIPHNEDVKGYRVYSLNYSKNKSEYTTKLVGDFSVQEKADLVKLSPLPKESNLLVSAIDKYGHETAPVGLGKAVRENDWFTPILNETGEFTFELESDRTMYWEGYTTLEDKPQGTDIRYEFSVLENGSFSPYTDDFASLSPSKHIRTKITMVSNSSRTPSLFALEIYYNFGEKEIVLGELEETQNIENNKTINPRNSTKIAEEVKIPEGKQVIEIRPSLTISEDAVEEPSGEKGFVNKNSGIKISYKDENGVFQPVNTYTDIPKSGNIVLKIETTYERGDITYRPTIVTVKENATIIAPPTLIEKKNEIKKPVEKDVVDRWETIQTLGITANSNSSNKVDWIDSEIQDEQPEHTRITYTYQISDSLSSIGAEWIGEYKDIKLAPDSRRIKVVAKLEVNQNFNKTNPPPKVISIKILSDQGVKKTKVYEKDGLEIEGRIKDEVPAGWVPIYTAQELQTLLKSSTPTEKYKYILMDHIDLDVAPYNTGVGWSPINLNADFDGNGLEIRNLYINRPTTNNVGLFSRTTYSTIQNLKIVDANVAGSANVGTIVGATSRQTNIYRVGIENSIVKGVSAIGGLVGSVDWSANSDQSTVSETYVKNTSVTGSGNNVGGLIGSTKTLYNTTISNNYAFATVVGKSYVGGLIGDNDTGHMSPNNYAVSTVPQKTSSNPYIGALYGWTTATTSYFNKEIAVAGQSGNSSFGKTTEQMKKKATYIKWDFNKVWIIDEGNDYPRLRWE